ncbi:bifunctional DNA primase/polymerase, partial [Loigolactobacillus coryniformis]|uniref:bifunctional DNA primase/polymerase n=1 Tax=Loigolactobacillus coryniformis TaxID=1610 RepID=UPI00201A7C74
RNGLKNASADPEQVKAWWTAEPQANIGMPTGHGFDVIDVDGPVGWSSWVDLEPKVPFIAKVFTGGGGLHVYVAATGRGNGAHLKPGIDY